MNMVDIYHGPCKRISAWVDDQRASLPMLTSVQGNWVSLGFSPIRSSRPSRTNVRVRAEAKWRKACSRQELDEGQGLFRGKVGPEKIFVQEYEGELYCLSNVCTHLSLPLFGRTALLQGKIVDGCVECPAHKTRFNLESGNVQGEWAPDFPEIPFLGKGPEKPLPTFEVKEEEGDIMVLV